jgi:hypothetical protein
MRRPALRFLLPWWLASASWAAAQVCGAELQQALPGAGATPGQVAASLLARAVQLIEPALPPQRGGIGPIEGAGAAADAVTFLHQRLLLPDGWSPDGHTPAAWSAMLALFVAPYQAIAPPATGADTRAMLAEAALALEVVANAVRPLPVFAVDAAGRVTFFAVIWNWTPYPRLLVFRPDPEVRLAEGPTSREAAPPVLEAMANCALRFEHFVYASEAVALRLFVAQGTSTLLVLGSEPALDSLPRAFAAGEVIDVLTFRSPVMDGVEVASVSIEGPAPGFGAVLQVLFHVRTNVGFDTVMRALALP